VLSVFLGATATPLQQQIHADAGRPYDPAALLQPADVAESVHAALCLPRSAELTELHLRPRAAQRLD
jgi:NADP-dependent 3-hydroxy acid dehydrogenase YdfG